ncbi:protein TE39 [Testudinid alphaherpesvirus 3]|uniref:Protein TE39 n=1 Tax=Testudinid alphaherpesvirus 3 TaxID=2560801 RepID=A0A0M3LD90_9ALPH|nr:protein TE39 [Testudinid alphaherpesvirus 3]AIU39346.1 protein TE39 [Testudinid alphaherpesvirus 3]AIU39440.1 protein TE39 [Testudinid alphaherpesvirus 3]AKI81715.1 protein TE39 [Testudinid alphaherpesvirus 3]AKI81816.1 protein TE39 [Testudinid alphaherpesvirus 3]
MGSQQLIYSNQSILTSPALGFLHWRRMFGPYLFGLVLLIIVIRTVNDQTPFFGLTGATDWSIVIGAFLGGLGIRLLLVFFWIGTCLSRALRYVF